MPGWTTSQPRLIEVADQARDAALVAGDRPRREHHGVARAGGHVAVLAQADHRERRERLALAARDEHQRARGERVAQVGRVEPRHAAELQQAEVERRLGVVDHAAAEEGDRPARGGRETGHVLDARHRGREARDEHTPAGAREHLLESRDHGVLAGREPRLLDVGAVGEQRQHAAFAPLRERRDVGALVGLRLRVDLEVAARQHDTGWRLDRERQAVDDAVRDADRVHAEGSDLDRLAEPQRPELGAHAPLLETPPREAEREPTAVDGRRRRRERVRERADVVLVAVRQQDSAHAVAALGEVLEVGDDEVDAGHLGGGEEHAGVEQQQVVLPLEDHRVQPELTQAPERNEADHSRSFTRGSILRCAPRDPRPSLPTKAAPAPQPIGSRRASTPRG